MMGFIKLKISCNATLTENFLYIFRCFNVVKIDKTQVSKSKTYSI